jgi:hypothetical protein
MILNISIFEYIVKGATRGKFNEVLQVAALPNSLQFQAVSIIHMKTAYSSRITCDLSWSNLKFFTWESNAGASWNLFGKIADRGNSILEFLYDRDTRIWTYYHFANFGGGFHTCGSQFMYQLFRLRFRNGQEKTPW